MNKFWFAFQIFAIAIFTFAFASVAHAQATRTWVSGVGDDVNPCSRTAPCKTFAGAISKTATNGEIDALDPAGYGAVTITKSITIDGSATMAGILNAQTNGVIINLNSAADTQRTVRLRGLSIQGAGTGINGVRITSSNLSGSKVYVEDCIIDGQNGTPGRGIDDARKDGGFLAVSNTTIRNNAGTGISVDPNGGTGSTQINVTVSSSRIHNCLNGIAFGSNVKATIYNSSISGNTNAGVFAQQTAGGTTEIAVDHCVVSNNGTGFQASSASTSIRVSNTTAMNNATLTTTAGGGQVSSYGNNQTGGASIGPRVSPG